MKSAAFGLAVLVLAGLAVGYIVHVREDMSDFGVCFKGGERVLAGETLYRASDGHLQFKYAPAGALFFAGPALLPFEAAKAVWYVLSLVFLFWIARMGLDILPPGPVRRGLIGALGFLVMAKFLARELELGQVNLLILFLLGLMATALIRGRQVPAGIAAGASLFFKPYALVFLPYLLAKRKWKALAMTAIMAVAGFALPMTVYGPGGSLALHGEWIDSLRVSSRDLLAAGDNASLAALVLKNAGPVSNGTLLLVLAAAVILLGLVFLGMIGAGRKIETVKAEGLEAAFLMALIPLFSPLGWVYNYLYGFWAVLFLVAGMGRLPLVFRALMIANLGAIGLTVIEVVGRRIFDAYNNYAVAAVNFLVVLAGLAVLRFKGRA
jgi:hypothetical protein